MRTHPARATPWRGFTNEHASRPEGVTPTVVHKLYVSPGLDALPEVFETVVESLTELSVAEFKIGRSLEGVLRADKLVAYFSSFEALARAAARLRSRLAGCPAQGVPFTAPIDEAGLLSWGLDPPARRGEAAWTGRESWRLWVTRRLGAALVAATQDERPEIEAWRFALDRVRFEGFDTRSWTPSERIWRDAPSIPAPDA
jgi:hypothetical protein